jgi:hypothetical protein
MANTHVALYDLTTGIVLQLFERTSFDDSEDTATTGTLTVDSVLVAEGIDTAVIGAVALSGPTADDVAAPPFAMEVDSVVTPTDTAYLTTVGIRDPVYFGDTDTEGRVPMAE